MYIPDKYETIFQLSFSDPELANLVVSIRWSYGLIDSAAEMITVDVDAIQAGTAGPEDIRKIRQLVDDFSGALVGWNLTDDQNQPLPTDRDTVRSRGVQFVLALVGSFMAAVDDLSKTISRSHRVEESELPMDDLTVHG